MNNKKQLNQTRLRRQKRTRAKIFGNAERPRFSIFRSNQFTYVQLIDDSIGKTMISASTRETNNSEELLGELVAKKALEKNIKSAIFDRGGYKYHGRVKIVAEGARKGGLQL